MKSDPPITSAAISKEDVGADQEPEGSGHKSIKLTSANFAQLSRREEMTENRLRTAQNRYLLHRAYASKAASFF